MEENVQVEAFEHHFKKELLSRDFCTILHTEKHNLLILYCSYAFAVGASDRY